MFTLEQIKAAHSKVKTGADFRRYIQDLIQLGITSYVTLVADGDTSYRGANDYAISSGPKYALLNISHTINHDQFRSDLKIHQQGQTDFPMFCSDCAKSGIEKWMVDLGQMTCTYFDCDGNKVLTEEIGK